MNTRAGLLSTCGCAVALVLLSGCRQGGTPPIATSCGTGGHAVYAGFSDPRLPTFSARVRAEIGAGRLAHDTVPFGEIASVAADATHVYTLDAMNQAVFVHTLSGDFVTSFGRQGDGPGEFAQPSAIGLVAPDSLFVFDVGLWRLSVFSTRGRLLRTEVVGREAAFGQVYDVRFGPEGEVYQLGWGRYQASLSAALGPSRGGTVRGTNTLLRWDERARSWRELADVPGLEVYVDAGKSSIADVPFAARVLWDPARDGLWYADNETFRLVRISLDGQTRCEVRVSRPHPPVTDSEREAYYEASDVASDPRLVEHLASIRQRRANVPVPSDKPELDALVVSDEGNLWIRVPGQRGAAAAGDRATWQVFTPRGEPIGSGSLPASLRPIVIRQDEVIGVLTDSLGVERVSMLSVSWHG